MSNNMDIALYSTEGSDITIEVSIGNDTVWLYLKVWAPEDK